MAKTATKKITTTKATTAATPKATILRSQRQKKATVVDSDDEEDLNAEPGFTGETLGNDVNHLMEPVEPGELGSEEAPMEICDDSDEGEEDDEAELNRLKKTWTLPIYGFFEPTPDICYVSSKPGLEKRKCHEFVCNAKYCKGKSRIVRRFLHTGDESSTGNLHKHAKRCWGDDSINEAMETDAKADDVRDQRGEPKLRSDDITVSFKQVRKGRVTFSTRNLTKTESRVEYVRWISESLRSFNIVKDRGFITLMKSGRPGTYIPSPSTISRDVKLVFEKTRQRIAKILQKHDGKLNFATDAWTSPNHRAFIAITVHIEQNGEPFFLLLDFVEVPVSHSGLNLATVFASILRDFGIENKILSVTCDNASPNVVMVNELEKLVEAFPGEANLTRCFNHILSLTAKTVVRQFDVVKGKEDEALDEAERALQDLAAGHEIEDLATQVEELRAQLAGERTADNSEDDPVEGWEDERALLSEIDREELDASVWPVKLLLVKLRKISFSLINSSTLLLPKWEKLLKALKKKVRRMPRDVQTRWNSTYDMLSFAYEYRDAIDTMAADKDNGLRKFELDADEWELVRQLRDVLEVFKHATLFFSRGTPSLATVIPAMDHIDKVLTTASINNVMFSPAIRAALSLAKKTLNKYYTLSDSSEVYRITMILHPSFKLRYFESMGWDVEWIDTAREIIETEFARSYTGKYSLTPTAEHATKPKSQLPTNIFDTLPAFSGARAQPIVDELAAYLAQPTENIVDALKWWVAKKTIWRNLARMALDYLSIPATSTDVERVFSRGRILLSHTRNRLSAATTRSLMCLGGWSLLGLVCDSDVKAVAVLPDIVEVEDGGEDKWEEYINGT
ncbi:hypothetical protein D9615_006461 [Tricholomella constricta]|uniref:HAT C-terminal dimerisation domain-containing protein n=1 Tax=Tricholomella constricta TaxID=117010 RepID=A0A8H5H648_9AGAR|nr:hypothetical protein D9615_006461 [Tricholomella constricta]